MSDNTTIARPYAKAIFEHALAENKLEQWSSYLEQLVQVISVAEAAQFIANPGTTIEQHIQLFQEAFKSDSKVEPTFKNTIALLASNKRLALLPEIATLYNSYRAEQEKTLEVEVSSFSELNTEQQSRLIDSLSNRLKRQVALNITLDPELLGGAIIRAGDLVIDGSVRGKLNKLGTGLAA